MKIVIGSSQIDYDDISDKILKIKKINFKKLYFWLIVVNSEYTNSCINNGGSTISYLNQYTSSIDVRFGVIESTTDNL